MCPFGSNLAQKTDFSNSNSLLPLYLNHVLGLSRPLVPQFRAGQCDLSMSIYCQYLGVSNISMLMSISGDGQYFEADITTLLTNLSISSFEMGCVRNIGHLYYQGCLCIDESWHLSPWRSLETAFLEAGGQDRAGARGLQACTKIRGFLHY